MKIDYSKIIDKANARKDVLIKLSAQTDKAPEMHEKLVELMHWFKELSELWAVLDGEGRALISPKAQNTLGTCSSYLAKMSETRQTNYAGVVYLIEDGGAE